MVVITIIQKLFWTNVDVPFFLRTVLPLLTLYNPRAECVEAASHGDKLIR